RCCRNTTVDSLAYKAHSLRNSHGKVHLDIVVLYSSTTFAITVWPTATWVLAVFIRIKCADGYAPRVFHHFHLHRVNITSSRSLQSNDLNFRTASRFCNNFTIDPLNLDSSTRSYRSIPSELIGTTRFLRRQICDGA